MQKPRSLGIQGDEDISMVNHPMQAEPPLVELCIDKWSIVDYETRVVLGDLKRMCRLKDDLIYRDSVFQACEEDLGHHLETKSPREVQMESYLSMKKSQTLLKECRHRAMKTLSYLRSRQLTIYLRVLEERSRPYFTRGNKPSTRNSQAFGSENTIDPYGVAAEHYGEVVDFRDKALMKLLDFMRNFRIDHKIPVDQDLGQEVSTYHSMVIYAFDIAIKIRTSPQWTRKEVVEERTRIMYLAMQIIAAARLAQKDWEYGKLEKGKKGMGIFDHGEYISKCSTEMNELLESASARLLLRDAQLKVFFDGSSIVK